MLSEHNSNILRGVFGANFSIFAVAIKKENNMVRLIRGLRGLNDGVSDTIMIEISNRIKSDATTIVFIDGSNLGSIAKVIKSRFPSIQVITYFHNIESKFFLDSLLQAFSIRSLFIFLSNYLAERKAANFSDRVICLNKRDSDILKRYFKRSATHICPLTLIRPTTPCMYSERNLPSGPFALFVGGGFYANVQGIRYYNKHIAPHIQLPLYVIGHGIEDKLRDIELSSRIYIQGSVENLEPWYRRASFVVAPILSGSGMKTKVAEAMMYGKKIVGTPEAFVGYEFALPSAGWCCTTPKEFLNACISAADNSSVSYHSGLVTIYEKFFSPTAAFARFSEIFGQ